MDGCLRLEDSPVAREAGIYLWTVPYEQGYLIYAAGQTLRTFITRLREHTRAHREGFFTLFDPEELRRGRRVEIWHGSFGKKLSSERAADFEERREEIQRAAARQITSFRVFVGPLQRERRLLARIEAGIMDSLYAAPAPFSEVPDRGMSLSRRWKSEHTVRVNNLNAESLHALPGSFEV
ncbi:MAG: hypothetical protein JJU11_13360 [Candidatus Sumerlaeia bacterium]|nr:hypothetical protein [Candidatus Sumerlaeia bacterium]